MAVWRHKQCMIFFSIVWNWFCSFFFKQSLECFWICRRHILLLWFCIFHTDSLRALACCRVSFSKGHRKSYLSVRKFSKWLLSCSLLTPFQAGRRDMSSFHHLEQKSVTFCLWPGHQGIINSCGSISNVNQLTLHCSSQNLSKMGEYGNLQKHLAPHIRLYLMHSCQADSPGRGNINPEISLWSA